MDSLGISLGGIIAGLVWAEQWFRWRERQHARAVAKAQQQARVEVG